jgi:hypothetical protein
MRPALTLVLLLTANPALAGEVSLTPQTFAAKLAGLQGENGRFPDTTRLVLAPGQYELTVQPYVDPTCGNCEDPQTPVAATVGLRIAGRGIDIQGEDATIVTHAGYGLLFEDCEDCRLEGVTITGGVRDADGNATDAAVVARRSTLTVEDCRIVDNVGDPEVVREVVVGIMGICGREGAELTLEGNDIVRNSWDGIAMYRGARATIVGNRIDGVDKARGRNVGGGRGVGIGLTWDARARVERNLVTRYWKGIGVFVDADATVRHNLVEEILTWGIAYWDAGKGQTRARIEGNVIYDTGACGISISRETPGDDAPGHCTGNVIVHTGQNPKYDDPEYYCQQCPLAVHGRPDEFTIEENVFADNRCAEGVTCEESTAAELRAATVPLLEASRFESARSVTELLARLRP